MREKRYKNFVSFVGVIFSIILFFRQDSIVWRGILIMYLVLFACGAILRQLQNRGTLRLLPRVLTSPTVERWFICSFDMLVFGYLIFYTDLAFDLYEPDFFVYCVAFIVLMYVGAYILNKQYVQAAINVVVLLWLAMFIGLHCADISTDSVRTVSYIYYTLLGLSVLLLTWKMFSNFLGDETIISFALICFALKDVYVSQIAPNLEPGSALFSTIPWLNQ